MKKKKCLYKLCETEIPLISGGIKRWKARRYCSRSCSAKVTRNAKGCKWTAKQKRGLSKSLKRYWKENW